MVNFPQCLKHASVISIYKKGSKDIISNYRPISLLNVYSKIFEKIIKFNLLKYLVSKSIVTPYQYGFRQGISTYNALTSFSETIYTTLNSNN